MLVLVATVWPATSGVAHGSAATPAAAGSLQADFNNDGFADLAVGAPFEGVGGIAAGGAVHVLYGTPTGLAGGGSQLFTQDSPGVGSAPEDLNQFGWALAGSGPQTATAAPASPASDSGERRTARRRWTARHRSAGGPIAASHASPYCPDGRSGTGNLRLVSVHEGHRPGAEPHQGLSQDGQPA
jgi:hypothetical protein